MAKPAKKRTTKKAPKPEVVQENLEPTVESTVEPTADDAQLTIADLQNISKLIDIATRRGAFGAGEMSDVGVVYDKLSKFLNIIAQQKLDADAAANGGT